MSVIGRRPLLLALVLAVACTSVPEGATSATPSVVPVTSKARIAPLTNFVFGARAKPRGAQDQKQAITALEKALGRRLDGDRVFRRWDHAFPTPYVEWTRDLGRTVFVSVRARRVNGGLVTWRSIANAAPGTSLHREMVRWGQGLRSFGSPVYVTFHHEPDGETSRPNGTPHEFVQAWRAFHDVVEAQGATNVIWLWTLTAAAFSEVGSRGADAWYPGDSYVDHVGADGYNWFGCRSGRSGGQWRTFREIFDPARRWTEAHPGKRLFAPEWGSQEDPAKPDRKSEWIADALMTLREPAWANWGGMLYFHSEDPPEQFANPCEWWVDSSLSSLRAFKAMAAVAIASP